MRSISTLPDQFYFIFDRRDTRNLSIDRPTTGHRSPAPISPQVFRSVADHRYSFSGRSMDHGLYHGYTSSRYIVTRIKTSSSRLPLFSCFSPFPFCVIILMANLIYPPRILIQCYIQLHHALMFKTGNLNLYVRKFQKILYSPILNGVST